jgi:DDE superfamily endonuclease
MKPYSKRHLTDDEIIANYRFSRARRVSENALGIMANVFRVLHTPILLSPEKVEKVVLAVCALHNFLRQRARCSHINPYLEGKEQADISLTQLQPTVSRNASSEAKDIREHLKNHFIGSSRVAWQDSYCSSY